MYRYFRGAEETNIFWRFIDGDTPAEGFDAEHPEEGWHTCSTVFLEHCVEEDIEVTEEDVNAVIEQAKYSMLPFPYGDQMEPASWMHAESAVAELIQAMSDQTDVARAATARKIMAEVLRRFRPDLIKDTQFTKKIQVVCQQGGSTGEYYGSGYNTPEDAQKFIDGCGNDGAYNCTGPYETEVHTIGGVDYIKETDVYELLGEACGDAATDNFADYEERDEDEDDEDEEDDFDEEDIEGCEICGAEVLHDKHNTPEEYHHLPQGDYCNGCDRVICPNCVGDKTMGPHEKTMCKECSAVEESKSEDI
jgi:FlaG/FlaF family flagellin (archaellin)